MAILVGRCLKRKTVSKSKGVHKQKLVACSLCILQELYTAFKQKHPNVNMITSISPSFTRIFF